MNPIEEYFYRIPEPDRSMLLYIREQLLHSDAEISETFSFQLPFLKYKGKMLCYFYYCKKRKLHYLSFYHGDQLHHPLLVSDGRKKFKVLYLESNEDIDMSIILSLVDIIKSIYNKKR